MIRSGWAWRARLIASAPPVAAQDGVPFGLQGGADQLDGERIVVDGQERSRSVCLVWTRRWIVSRNSVRADRLDDVLRGAEREPLAALVEHRDDDDGDVLDGRVLLGACEDVPAVELWQDDVQDDARRPQSTSKLQAGRAVPRDSNIETGRRQVELEGDRPTPDRPRRPERSAASRRAARTVVSATGIDESVVGSGVSGGASAAALARAFGRVKVNVLPDAELALDRDLPTVQLHEALRAGPGPARCPPAVAPIWPTWRNSSKTCAWSSGAIPMPVSRTATWTPPSTIRAETSTCPPSGVNFTALESRLKTTCLTFRSSASMRSSAGSTSSDERDAVVARPLAEHGQAVVERLGQGERAQLELHPSRPRPWTGRGCR